MVNFVIAEGMLSEMPTKAEGKILMVVTEDCVVPVGKMAMLSDIKIEQVETLDPILLSNLIVEKATENGERDICVHTNNQDVEKLFTKRQVKINGFTFRFEAKQLGKAGRKTKEMPAARKARKRTGTVEEEKKEEKIATGELVKIPENKIAFLKEEGVPEEIREAFVQAVDKATDAEIGLPMRLKMELAVLGKNVEEYPRVEEIAKKAFAMWKGKE